MLDRIRRTTADAFIVILLVLRQLMQIGIVDILAPQHDIDITFDADDVGMVAVGALKVGNDIPVRIWGISAFDNCLDRLIRIRRLDLRSNV